MNKTTGSVFLIGFLASIAHAQTRVVPRSGGGEREARPSPIRNQNQIIRDKRRAVYPRQDASGTVISKQPTRIAPRQHAAIVGNNAVVRDIRKRRRVEVVPGRYYWRDVGGVRYCHYYDYGVHWYGFYHGPSFYWARYHNSRWWWFDVHFNRWTYWWDGYWWWPGPGGVMYVYVDNNYYPYENGGVIVRDPEVDGPPSEVPSPSEGHIYKSPDGRREVQVTGEAMEAFLYDRSSGTPLFLKFLGQNVSNVRYSAPSDGNPAQILLDFSDGRFALYSLDGDPLDKKPAASLQLPSSPPPYDVSPPSDSTSPPSLPPGTR